MSLLYSCACENCQIMERAESCVCCQEIEQVKNKQIEAVPGFHPECINRWVLQTAWYQNKQQYKDPYDGVEDKCFRHIAYR